MDQDLDAFLAEEEADLNEDMLCSFLDPEKENDCGETKISDSDRNQASWTRPIVSNPITGDQKLDFQQLEVDYCAGKPDPDFCEPSQRKLQTVPIVRIFGVTDAGNSVCAFVHGFEPYFYAKCITGRHSPSPDDLPAITEALNMQVMARAPKSGGYSQRAVVRVELVQAKSIWNYQPGPKDTFYKVTVSMPNLVTTARTTMEDGLDVDSGNKLCFSTFESNVLFVLRFMIDTGVVGGCWVTAHAGKYAVGTACTTSKRSKLSTCQIDIHLNYRQLEAHEAIGEWSRMAPFRIMSMDIECLGRKGCFPEADKDPVIQIASVVSVAGAKEPMLHHIVTLDTCEAIPGSQVEAFDNESDMLLRWQQLVAAVDPDIMIGYNILNFDFPYLVNRAQALKLPAFLHWGRIRGSALRMKDAQFSSKAYGTHAYKDITIEGRVQFDLLTAIQREHKLSSYSLNAVSAHFLGQQKEDVHHSCIADLQRGTSDTRRRLAIYCLKDALLPMRLFDKLKYMYTQVEMARVTGVPMSFLLTRGQSIKVFCQILRHAQKAGFLCPFLKGGYQADGVAYEGATVLQANTGYYTEPIATLDFASLYPSIMMAHNLCYSTLVPLDDVGSVVPEEHIERTPGGDCFVKASVCKGLLPQILEDLLAARKRAKKDLKAATDPFEKAVLDGRQLALKVSANSVYGFTGATVGKLCCLPISASTTAYGRRMIEHTKSVVEAHYTKANGYESDCVVIYGDTDSVMVNFKTESLARAMELGEEAAERVTKEFPPPVKLEFEKVYFPYLLMSKKRYAGLLWTNPDKWDKMDTKGIESVRRDNCLMVRKLVTTVLDCLLKDRDLDTAVEHVKTVIADLLLNRIDMSDLVVSKNLTQYRREITENAMKEHERASAAGVQEADQYKSAAAHVELSKKMAKRDSATAPQVGERVAFVIIKGAKGAKAHEKAEDPIYALEHNLPIDAQHYLEHHLSQPLLRIFEPILGEKKAKSLLSGDHTRSIQLTTPTASIGGIMRFAQKTLKCLNCKTALPSDRTTLCIHCESKEAEIYGKSMLQAAALETEYGLLWTQCQRCQGSLHLDVLCTSRDCPIFYRRHKVAKDVNEAQDNLARFAW